MTRPYAYLVVFTHPETHEKFYYYGATYGSDPEVIAREYFASSHCVRELRDWFGDGCFRYEVRRTFADVGSCRHWVDGVLRRMRVESRTDWLRDDFSPLLLGGDAPQIRKRIGGDRRGDRNPMYGRRHTVESREAMRRKKIGLFDGKRNPMHGRHHGSRARMLMSQKKRGRRWVNRDGVCLMVPIGEDVETYLANGWSRGRGSQK